MAQSKSKTPLILTDDEKLAFAKVVYEAKKSGPNVSWVSAIEAGRQSLPEGRRIGSSISAVHHLAWLQRLLDKCEKDDKARKVIDHRNSLQAAPAILEQEAAGKLTEKKKGSRGGPRLHLKPDEKMAFAEAAYAFRIANPGLAWSDALKAANAALLPHRQFLKPQRSPSFLPWLPPLLEEISKRPPPPFQPEPAPEEVVAAPATPTDIDDASANALANLLLQNLPALMKSPKFQNAFANGLAPAQQTAIQNEKKVDTRKKVIVVGLLEVQYNDVRRDFGKVFDLRLLGPNVPVPQIREAMKNADFAILMTQFVSHSTASAMRSHPGFYFCKGNQTALRDLLRERMAQ